MPPSNDKAKNQTKSAATPKKILAIDIGGSKVKILLSDEIEPRKIPSGKRLTPARMVKAVRELAKDWNYAAVSIGYPGLVGDHGPRSEPGNLGPGWVGFDYAAAFEKPVRIINDAAMQAFGSYDGGRMLFLGLGTGIGSALIAEKVIVTLELGGLMYGNGKTLYEVLGKQGLAALGKNKWREAVRSTVAALSKAFVVDHVVLGGGNAKYVRDLPAGVRLGHNLTSFRGGFRLWEVDDVQTLPPKGLPSAKPAEPEEWRLI
jgi:predicted NBD/HSP70 family sugar kinase